MLAPEMMSISCVSEKLARRSRFQIAHFEVTTVFLIDGPWDSMVTGFIEWKRGSVIWELEDHCIGAVIQTLYGIRGYCYLLLDWHRKYSPFFTPHRGIWSGRGTAFDLSKIN
jgi:hypothetical protein